MTAELPSPRRPLSEEQRKVHRDVVEGAWQRRSAARTELTEQREKDHARIEHEYYVAMSRIDSEYDNAVHEGLNAG